MSQYRLPPPSLALDSSDKIQSIKAWYDRKNETVDIGTSLESSDEEGWATSDDEDNVDYRATIIKDCADVDDRDVGCVRQGKGKHKPNGVQYDAVYKVLVLGDTGVGKTSLIRCLDGRPFSNSHVSTIGIDFIKKTFEVDGAKVQLHIWDTAGQERFRSITKFHYRGTQGLLLVYDVTDENSLETLGFWLNSIDRDLEDSSNQPVPVFMLANKADLVDARQVTMKTGQKVADRHCVEGHIETSAKEETNVASAFYKLARAMTEVFDKELMELYKHDVEKREHVEDCNTDGESKKKKKKKKKKKRKSIKLKSNHEKRRKVKCSCG